MKTNIANRFARMLPLLLTLISGAVLANEASVGEVLFTIGEVRVVGQDRPLVKGSQVAVGQTLQTGSNGHLHVRFVDQAFVSLRPGSALRIEAYQFDAADPARNRVRFTLEKGASRLVTGQAGQQNKEGFRLNTPVAAIGVRGTDFVVQTTAHATWVTVQQGAIVLSPFDSSCLADGFGACGGALARQLSGSLGGAYLELAGPGRVPVLVPQGQGSRNPNQLTPPRPEEPEVHAPAGMVPTSAPENGSLPTQPSASNGQPIWWGRWSNNAAPDLSQQVGREIIVRNEAILLTRSTENVSLPDKGVVKFRAVESNTYLRPVSGAYQPLALSKAVLSVDFNKMQFTTGLNFAQGNLREKIRAGGDILHSGLFRTDAKKSDAYLVGTLFNNGDGAVYYFEKLLKDQQTALGVVRWQR